MSRVKRRQVGLVGGESARAVLHILRSFPLSVDGSGRIVVHNTATGEEAALFRRAYEAVELEVIVKEEHCEEHPAHATLDATDFEWLILNELAWKAKKAVGEAFDIEAPWLVNLNGDLPVNARYRLRR
jgi:hypothetical protein